METEYVTAKALLEGEKMTRLKTLEGEVKERAEGLMERFKKGEVGEEEVVRETRCILEMGQEAERLAVELKALGLVEKRGASAA